jgi:hypothetical protein
VRITIDYYIPSGLINEWEFKLFKAEALKATMERSIDKLVEVISELPAPEATSFEN